jgi:hypothetical protein
MSETRRVPWEFDSYISSVPSLGQPGQLVCPICGELSQCRYSYARKWAITCTIGSSKYKNLKLKKRKEERAERVEELHISSLRVTCKANLYP